MPGSHDGWPATAAGRFRPLHGFAEETLGRLEARYDVARAEPAPPDRGFDLPGVELRRPIVRLTPADPAAAPLAVAFTAFPGLLVRGGRWLLEAFPACGCDHCAETLDGERARFRTLVDDVVQGRFREAIVLPWLGPAWQQWTVGPPERRSHRRWRISRADARALVAGGPRTIRWRPWSERPR